MSRSWGRHVLQMPRGWMWASVHAAFAPQASREDSRWVPVRRDRVRRDVRHVDRPAQTQNRGTQTPWVCHSKEWSCSETRFVDWHWIDVLFGVCCQFWADYFFFLLSTSSALSMELWTGFLFSSTAEKCSLCDKMVAAGYMTRHMRSSHSDGDSREFSCPREGCTRLYTTSYSLNQHIRYYHEDRGFECDFCGKKLSSKVGARFFESSKFVHLTCKTKARTLLENRYKTALFYSAKAATPLGDETRSRTQGKGKGSARYIPSFVIHPWSLLRENCSCVCAHGEKTQFAPEITSSLCCSIPFGRTSPETAPAWRRNSPSPSPGKNPRVRRSAASSLHTARRRGPHKVCAHPILLLQLRSSLPRRFGSQMLGEQDCKHFHPVVCWACPSWIGLLLASLSQLTTYRCRVPALQLRCRGEQKAPRNLHCHFRNRKRGPWWCESGLGRIRGHVFQREKKRRGQLDVLCGAAWTKLSRPNWESIGCPGNYGSSRKGHRGPIRRRYADRERDHKWSECATQWCTCRWKSVWKLHNGWNGDVRERVGRWCGQSGRSVRAEDRSNRSRTWSAVERNLVPWLLWNGTLESLENSQKWGPKVPKCNPSPKTLLWRKEWGLKSAKQVHHSEMWPNRILCQWCINPHSMSVFIIFDFQRPEVMPFDFQRPEVMPFDF